MDIWDITETEIEYCVYPCYEGKDRSFQMAIQEHRLAAYQRAAEQSEHTTLSIFAQPGDSWTTTEGRELTCPVGYVVISLDHIEIDFWKILEPPTVK